MDMEQMPPYGSGTIKVKCQHCRKDMITIVGKRERKYCSNSCRQKAYQSANKVEMITISKVEYDRLLSIETHLETILKSGEVNTKQKKIKGKSNGVESRTDDLNMDTSTVGMKLHESLGAVFLPKPNNKPDRLPGESTIDYKIRTAG